MLVFGRAAHSYPRGWLKQAACIHRHESVRWHRVTDWLSRPSPDHGGYQIDIGTWAVFAPAWWPRDPASASPQQQTLVAWRIYVANGRRWGHGRLGWQWPRSSAACGLN